MSAIERIKLAKDASASLAIASTIQKNHALEEIANLLVSSEKDIVSANLKDLERAKSEGLSAGLQDRLMLNTDRIAALANSIRQIVALPDPVGESVRGMSLPNGLKLSEVRVPFGVVGAIYEARPNVTVDISALALKAGNAVVLRGGTAAENTNIALVQVLQQGLAKAEALRHHWRHPRAFMCAATQHNLTALGLNGRHQGRPPGPVVGSSNK
jgi:glutamate-5-semialdehyde dehydrogenase